MARYVKTSMFLQSPETEHHTLNYSYVIFPHWEWKSKSKKFKIKRTNPLNPPSKEGGR